MRVAEHSKHVQSSRISPLVHSSFTTCVLPFLPPPVPPHPHPLFSLGVYYEEEEQLILSPEWALYFSQRQHARKARKGKERLNEGGGRKGGRQAGGVGWKL